MFGRKNKEENNLPKKSLPDVSGGGLVSKEEIRKAMGIGVPTPKGSLGNSIVPSGYGGGGGYGAPVVDNTNRFLDDFMKNVIKDEDETPDFVFEKIRNLLEDLAEHREFSEDLYDRFLSARILLEDLEAELALAKSRMELVGKLLDDFKRMESGDAEEAVDGEHGEELASP